MASGTGALALELGVVRRFAGSNPTDGRNFQQWNVGRQGRRDGGGQFLIIRLFTKCLDSIPNFSAVAYGVRAYDTVDDDSSFGCGR